MSRANQKGEPGGPHDGRRRAFVLHPDIRPAPGETRLRDASARLEEAVGLAAAIDLAVVHAETVRVDKPKPGTLFGGGVIDRVAQLAESAAVELVIVDGPLSPVQQRNLERALGVKVIDRTGLILEIFGARAKTREGELQVELAALSYQRSRLVRSWTHLERQRGGLGFIGGPGESQIELDRRLIDERIAKLKRQLEQVKRTRGLHRSARARVPYPVVALVGYTNAGKSTLFNRLTRARVEAKDMLFATLDPTMRAVTTPNGARIILSDTVGFISDLPTDLVAAFRATLEEVETADVILHVRDAASASSEAEKQDVDQVMRALGRTDAENHIEVLNKIDLVDTAGRADLAAKAARAVNTVIASAVTGENCGAIIRRIDELIARGAAEVELHLPHSAGDAVAWLYRNADIRDRRDEETGVSLRLRAGPPVLARFASKYPALAPTSGLEARTADKQDQATTISPSAA